MRAAEGARQRCRLAAGTAPEALPPLLPCWPALLPAPPLQHSSSAPTVVGLGHHARKHAHRAAVLAGACSRATWADGEGLPAGGGRPLRCPAACRRAS